MFELSKITLYWFIRIEIHINVWLWIVLVTKLNVYSLTYEWAQNVELTWIQKNRKPSLIELQNLVELKKT
jgi:hypothetical protein